MAVKMQTAPPETHDSNRAMPCLEFICEVAPASSATLTIRLRCARTDASSCRNDSRNDGTGKTGRWQDACRQDGIGSAFRLHRKPNLACQSRSTRSSGGCSTKVHARRRSTHAGPVFDTTASNPADPRRNIRITSCLAGTGPAGIRQSGDSLPLSRQRRQPAQRARRTL